MATNGAATALMGSIAGASQPKKGHDGAAQETLIAVPAGFFGALLGQLSGAVGGAIGGNAGAVVGGVGGLVGDLLPFQTLPAGAPAAKAPAASGDLIAVPAGFFGALLGSIGGSFVGDLIGGDTGADIGGGIGGVLGGILPFQVIPPGARA